MDGLAAWPREVNLCPDSMDPIFSSNSDRKEASLYIHKKKYILFLLFSSYVKFMKKPNIAIGLVS